MKDAIRSRRLARCAGCGLALELCVCASLPRLTCRTRVVVLMHKNELGRSSNTGRLVLAVLERAELSIRGELGTPPVGPLPPRRLVLFPKADARELRRDDAVDDLHLVVPDGSWSQARRMLAREAWADGVEVVKLGPCVPSRYDLRRQTRDGALCTFEAVAAALGVLEGPETERAMLEVLEAFLARARHVRRSGRAPF